MGQYKEDEKQQSPYNLMAAGGGKEGKKRRSSKSWRPRGDPDERWCKKRTENRVQPRSGMKGAQGGSFKQPGRFWDKGPTKKKNPVRGKGPAGTLRRWSSSDAARTTVRPGAAGKAKERAWFGKTGKKSPRLRKLAREQIERLLATVGGGRKPSNDLETRRGGGWGRLSAQTRKTPTATHKPVRMAGSSKKTSVEGRNQHAKETWVSRVGPRRGNIGGEERLPSSPAGAISGKKHLMAWKVIRKRKHPNHSITTSKPFRRTSTIFRKAIWVLKGGSLRPDWILMTVIHAPRARRRGGQNSKISKSAKRKGGDSARGPSNQGESSFRTGGTLSGSDEQVARVFDVNCTGGTMYARQHGDSGGRGGGAVAGGQNALAFLPKGIPALVGRKNVGHAQRRGKVEKLDTPGFQKK